MAAIGTLPVLLGVGIHASRPAASAVGKGGLYSCTTHSLVYQTDGSSWSTWASLSGTGLADPMTTRGDSIYRNASNVTDRFPVPLAGQVVGRSGSDLAAVYPPGYELDYVQATSNVNVTATVQASADTVITSSSVTFDGAPVMLEFYSPAVTGPSVSTGDVSVLLYDVTGSAFLGLIGYGTSQAANGNYKPWYIRHRFSPAAGARQYRIRAITSSAAIISAGAGGTGLTFTPMHLRIVKV